MTENENGAVARTTEAEVDHKARAARLPFVAHAREDEPEIIELPVIDEQAGTLTYGGVTYVPQAVADDAYEQRNRLVGVLAAVLRPKSHIGHSDPTAPDYAVAIVETPFGQASWHIPNRDLGFFEGIAATDEDSAPWDGHSNDEKHARLEAMRRALLGSVPADAEPMGDRLAAEVIVDVCDLDGDGDLEDLKARIEDAAGPWRPTVTVTPRRY